MRRSASASRTGRCGWPNRLLRPHEMTASFGATASRRVSEVELLLRSEEHTSELQSLAYLVCRLLLEKKKYIIIVRPFAHVAGLCSTRSGSALTLFTPASAKGAFPAVLTYARIRASNRPAHSLSWIST